MNASVKAPRATARRTHVAGLTAGLVTAALLTAGCTAGQRAQTADEQETQDGTTVRAGQYITVGAMALQTPSGGGSWASGSSVPITAVVVNSGRADDQLTSITSSSIAGWGVYPSLFQATRPNPAPSGAGAPPPATPDPVTIPAQSRVAFGPTSFDGGPSSRVLVVTGVKAPLYPGSSIALTLTFARAGTVTAQVPVRLSTSPETAVVPGPSATGQEG